jgi:hypothetical protein
MIEADRVLSTPPLNSSSIHNANSPPEAHAESVDSFSHPSAIGQPESPTLTGESGKPIERLSRRNVLAGLAVLPVALPAAADLAADPTFALVAVMRAAHAAHGEACDVLSAAEERYGFNSAEADEAYELGGTACDASYTAAWSLATTPPTTLAGVIKVLRFANQFEDEGMEWPDTDAIGSEGWHYRLRATMAQAIETILHKGAV